MIKQPIEKHYTQRTIKETQNKTFHYIHSYLHIQLKSKTQQTNAIDNLATLVVATHYTSWAINNILHLITFSISTYMRMNQNKVKYVFNTCNICCKPASPKTAAAVSSVRLFTSVWRWTDVGAPPKVSA